MGLKGYFKGLIRRLSNPKPIKQNIKTSKPEFAIKMIGANEVFGKGYAYGYYVFRIRVYNDPDGAIYDLTDEILATDMKCIVDRNNSEYVDLYISGTNEDIGEFIWSLWYETIHPLLLFDKSVVDYLEGFSAIYFYKNDNLDGWVASTLEAQNDNIKIKGPITELLLLDKDDSKIIPKEVERKLFGYILNIKDHYEFLSYDELSIAYTVEKNYINGRYQWIIDIIEQHPEVIKKLSIYNNIVQDNDTESYDFDPDIDEII